jgi:GT2 family glycosyltransferase
MRVLDGSAVQGCGPARGLGVADAKGGRIVFCDADDVVDPHWLSAMGEALGDADFVAGWFSLFRGETPSQPQRWRHPGVYCRFLPYASGCSMGVWRDRLLAVGGFDPQMVHSDDVDLSWRLQLAGYTLKDAHGARVHKRERQTPRDRWLQTYRWGRFDPVLFVRYRSQGMPRSLITKALLSYGWLLLALPLLPFSAARRDRWIEQSARRAGRIVGGIAERVVFL